MTALVVYVFYRVYCIAPMYVNTFNRLFDAHTSTRQWNAAKRLLEQLDTSISKKCVLC